MLAILYLTQIKVLNLPSDPTLGYPNPFIFIQSGNTTKQTKTLYQSRDPIYNDVIKLL